MTPARVYIDEDTATAHVGSDELRLWGRTVCGLPMSLSGYAEGPLILWDFINQDVVTPCAECWAYEPVDDGQLAMEVG